MNICTVFTHIQRLSCIHALFIIMCIRNLGPSHTSASCWWAGLPYWMPFQTSTCWTTCQTFWRDYSIWLALYIHMYVCYDINYTKFMYVCMGSSDSLKCTIVNYSTQKIVILCIHMIGLYRYCRFGNVNVHIYVEYMRMCEICLK